MARHDTYGDRLKTRVHELALTCQEALRDPMSAKVEAIFLYGSALGDGFRLDSDVDVAVLDRWDERLTWVEQARLMDHLERATGAGIDLRMLRDGLLSYQVNVLETGLRIWAGDPAAADRYQREVLASWRRHAPPSESEWSAALYRLAALPS